MRGKEKTLLHCQKHLPNGWFSNGFHGMGDLPFSNGWFSSAPLKIAQPTHPITILCPIFEPGHLHHKWTGKSHVTTICRSAHRKQNPRRRRYTEVTRKAPTKKVPRVYARVGTLVGGTWCFQPVDSNRKENHGVSLSTPHWCLTSVW